MLRSRSSAWLCGFFALGFGAIVLGHSSFSGARAWPRSYEIGNMDATIIAQKPKLSPHKAAIKASLCNIMGIHESALNIKAKTHEKVDSLGEERSIACHTVVLLVRK